MTISPISCFDAVLPSTDFHKNLVTCLLYCSKMEIRAIHKCGAVVKGHGIFIRPHEEHAVEFPLEKTRIIYLEDFDLASKISKNLAQNGEWAKAIEIPDKIQNSEANIIFDDITVFYDVEVDTRAPSPIERVLKTIIENPERRITQEQAAELVGMERTLFMKRFKKQTGLTFRQYKMWAAMKMALQIGEKGELVQNAALDSGFFDPAHFNRIFKSIFGLTPSQVISLNHPSQKI